MFGDQDNLIAQLTGETGETTYADADERFRNKLRLNKNTGSLTISNITSGPYNLQIISSKRTSYRKFRVFNSCESGPKTVSVMAGECLVLITDFKVERDEKVEWRFEDKILTTGMNGDIMERTFAGNSVLLSVPERHDKVKSAMGERARRRADQMEKLLETNQKSLKQIPLETD
ncbi:unnamed protein product [Leuciscus chuanchicus]